MPELYTRAFLAFCHCGDKSAPQRVGDFPTLRRFFERISLAEQRRKHALHGAEQRLCFAEARREIGDLLVFLAHLLAQELIVALEELDIARRGGLCLSSLFALLARDCVGPSSV